MERLLRARQRPLPSINGTRAATLAMLALTAMFVLTTSAQEQPSPDQEPDGDAGDEFAEHIASEMGGDPLADDRSFVARLTAYSYESCTTRSCLTRSETRTRWGVVAVDPEVVPLGSRLVIEGFEGQLFVAEDTGSGIRGAWIDLWHESTMDAVRFGVQCRKVMIL